MLFFISTCKWSSDIAPGSGLIIVPSSRTCKSKKELHATYLFKIHFGLPLVGDVWDTWAFQVFWASMSFQDIWASKASSMLKIFKKAFNIEEAHVS